jgi:hypothetical protein
MITASDRRKALELVHQVSLAGRGRVSPQVFLARICGAVSEAFNYDSVTALQFHPGSQEVSEVQAGGVRVETLGGERVMLRVSSAWTSQSPRARKIERARLRSRSAAVESS